MNGVILSSHKRFMMGMLCGLFLSKSFRVVADQLIKQAFGLTKTSRKGVTQCIGYFKKGCMAGSVALSIDRPNWQVERLPRNRNWEYSALTIGIKDIAAKAKGDGCFGLLVRAATTWMPNGQRPCIASNSLDVDFWFPPKANYVQPKRGFRGQLHA